MPSIDPAALARLRRHVQTVRIRGTLLEGGAFEIQGLPRGEALADIRDGAVATWEDLDGVLRSVSLVGDQWIDDEGYPASSHAYREHAAMLVQTHSHGADAAFLIDAQERRIDELEARIRVLEQKAAA